VAVVKGAIWVAEWDLPGYTELKALGSGGSGDVVLARHDAHGTLVAIKYLHRKLLADPQWVQSFRAEAQVLAALDDPNIVRLYEYVESPAGAAIVMELVDGVTVREILRHQGGTTPEAALVVLRGSLLGLAAAHRHGIVHRDYKPENVLVNGNGDSKLTDFGIAARTGGETLPTGTVMYAPPEQFAGAPASPVGDVYAATATFYECLTGHPPFVGDTAERLLYQHLAEPVPLEPVPEPLRSLVVAGMAKEPENRPADATTFIAALDTVASGAYGPDWAKRGRSHLGEAALLLAALWPSGAPPAVQGSAVEKVNLSHGSQDAGESRHLLHLWHVRHLRHLEHLRRRRLSPVAAAVGAAAAVALLTVGAALAVGGNSSAKLSASIHPTTVQQVALQPLVAVASHPASGSSSPSVAAGFHSSSSGSSSPGSPPGASPGTSSASSSASAKASSSAKASASASPSPKASASSSTSSSPPAPALTGISPASGSTGGGTSVTITGTGLAGTKGVSFGGAGAAITADSATQITVTSPPGNAGTVNVIVVTPGGTTAGQFTYVAPPVVRAVSSTTGPTGGGTSVTITGTGLAGASVSFGGAAGTITADSATQITVTSPPVNAAGTVAVTVTTSFGTAAAGQFTYYVLIQ
jgi:eukaryotic-like serine/threonine-protein kinase